MREIFTILSFFIFFRYFSFEVFCFTFISRHPFQCAACGFLCLQRRLSVTWTPKASEEVERDRFYS